MNAKNLEQIRGNAPVLGAYIGGMWIASFVCMANVLKYPILSLFGLGLCIGSIIAIPVFAYQFRWRVCQGEMSFMESWILVIQILFYASILMAGGVYLYMQFLDQGNFASYYETLLSDPATKAMMDQILSGSGTTAEDFVAQVTSISPINLAINILESDILLGFIGSVPLALLSRIKVKSSSEKKRVNY